MALEFCDEAVNNNLFAAFANSNYILRSKFCHFYLYANAEVECVFSTMNLFKSEIRNRMPLNLINQENYCCKAKMYHLINVYINSINV